MEANVLHVKSDESEISLGGIFDYLLGKWKSVVIVCCIGLVMGAVFAFLPERISVEMKNVNIDKVEVFHGYNELLEKSLLKNQEDVIINFNPDTTYSGTQNLYIEASIDEINLIFDKFMLLLNDDDFWADISAIYDNKYEIEDLRYLVSMSHSIESDGADRVLGSIEEFKSLKKRGELIIYVLGSSQDTCNKMLDVAYNYITELEKQIIDGFSSYQRRSFIEKTVKSRNSVENRKDSLLRETESIVSKVASLKKDLTDDEKTLYYKDLYPEEEQEKSLMSYLKMPVLMTFLAAFIICFVYVMKYIFNHQVKTASELTSTFGMNVFGVYKVSEDKKGFDGVLQRREAKKDLVVNTSDYIINSIKELDKMPVVLLGDKNNKVISAVMDEFTGKCNQLLSYGLLQSDSDSISVSHKSNGVIFVVNLWDTTIDEINREIEIAIVQGINVLGCIVVK